MAAPSDLVVLAHDALRQGRHPLESFFRPRGVAVVGATDAPGSVGRTLLHNLMSTTLFGGTIYPVNPRRETVLGLKAYRSLADVAADVAAPIDLAVVVTPAETVPSIVAQCADRGVPAAIIISAGFRETGAASAALEQRILAEARRGAMRIIGPNCLGVMSPMTGSTRRSLCSSSATSMIAARTWCSVSNRAAAVEDRWTASHDDLSSDL